VAGAAVLAAGHTPYRQWAVYRRRFLIVLTNKLDEPSFPLGKTLAAVLAKELPESKARVARAPHAQRIASLIGSKQMDVALLRREEAAAMLAGRAPFADYGAVPLRAIAGLGPFLLVSRDDFPDPHAYAVAETLSVHRDALRVPLTPDKGDGGAADPVVPMHAGARAFFDGLPAPVGARGEGGGEEEQ